MPSFSTVLRVLAGSVVVVLTTTGCVVDNAARKVVSRTDLVNRLASWIDDAYERTYAAHYQLPGGETALIAQSKEPPRAAYDYPGGKLTITTEAITECVTTGSRSSCTVSSPPRYANKPSVEVLRGVSKHGLVTPPVVMNLLTTAALDPDAVIDEHDTTLATRHATCVRVTNADVPDFDTCITTEGVLGSFTGTVDGTKVDITLSRFDDVVDNAAFTLPPGARIDRTV